MTLPLLVGFGREICGDLQAAERREWWLSNGLGAYAAGTVAGTLTRRYHGLLIAPLSDSLDRHLLVAKVDAELIDLDAPEGKQRWPLHSNRWADGVIEPQGYRHIERFELDGRMPVWRFAVGDLVIEQRIWMEFGKHTTHVAFRLVAGERARPPRLRLNLLVNGRDHHAVARRGQLHPVVDAVHDRLHVNLGTARDLRILADGADLKAAPEWIERFDLPLEGERGLERSEDHFRAGIAELELAEHTWRGISFTLEEDTETNLNASRRRSLVRDAKLLAAAIPVLRQTKSIPKWVGQLVLAADSFRIRRTLPDGRNGESVIAGYPWFGDWGRDTMLALPGLTLATGRPGVARDVLVSYAGLIEQGLLPNYLPVDDSPAEFNSVDAALWYLEAWRVYLEHHPDPELLEQHFPMLDDIVRHYRDGTRFGIGMDPADGLLRAGEEGVQLTWMDAKVGDWVVTPRHGKPVEINALWFNALHTLAGFAQELRRDAAPYTKLAEQVRASFQRYVRGPDQGLYDVLDGPAPERSGYGAGNGAGNGSGDDASVRPNQILAVSLHQSPLDDEQQADVVRECSRQLLTSHGLRSLAPDHPDYCSEYRGDVRTRDSAYHQGTVWAWLLGHYVLAEHRVSGNRERAEQRLRTVHDHLFDAGLGTVSEIFDGDPPHRPRGAPAQAWSVACILEAWWRLKQ